MCLALRARHITLRMTGFRSRTRPFCGNFRSSALDGFPCKGHLRSPTFEPDLPTEGSSIQSKQSSSSVSSPSIVSHAQWPCEHRQSLRSKPAGRNDTCWQILRSLHACVPELAGRCCSSYRYKASRTGCKRCRRKYSWSFTALLIPNQTVILSGVNASRSEAFTESKDPMPAYTGNGDARHSHRHSMHQRELPCSVRTLCRQHGVLRLRG